MQGSSLNYPGLTYGCDFPSFGIDGTGVLDTFPVNTPNVDCVTAQDINLCQDAILNIETKVGEDSSAVATSIDYLLKSIVGGHYHDGVGSRKLTGINATHFDSLSGANLTNLNATELTSGTIPDARFPATLPALDGSLLTALNATELTSGIVPLARLSGITTTELAVAAGILTTQLADQNVSQFINDSGYLIDLSAFTTTDLAEGVNLYYTDTRARASISSTVTGLTYTGGTGILSTTLGYGIPTTAKQANWDTAYGWGNHASAGYITPANLASYSANIKLNDNYNLYLGTGNDLRLYHNGSSSQIYNNTGQLNIRNYESNADIVFQVNDGGVQKNAFYVDASDNARLYTNGINPISPGVNNFGDSSNRWNQVYAETGNFSLNMTIGGTITTTGAGTINGTVIDTNEIDFASATATIQIQGNTRVYYSSSETVQYNQFRPHANKGYNLGTNSYAWDNVYADDFINKCMWLDTEDDLALLEAIKPLKDKNGELVLEKGKAKIDYNTLPDFVRPHYKYQFRTNEQNEKQFGKGKTPKNIDGYSIGNMLDLAIGAIRQLNKKVNDLEKLLVKKK